MCINYKGHVLWHFQIQTPLKKPFLLATNIAAVTIGNEVLFSNNSLLIQSLLPSMSSIHSALASLGFGHVAVTTAHSLNVLSTSYPPSAGAFRKDLLPYVTPLLAFLNKTGSPFLINAYPFFAYKADPKRISLDYVLWHFQIQTPLKKTSRCFHSLTPSSPSIPCPNHCPSRFHCLLSLHGDPNPILSPSNFSRG